MARRKSGTVPTYAKNQTDLGGYLAPPRDRKIIQQALKLEGNPGRSLDGRYHVQEWQGFINANFTSFVDPNVGSSGDKKNLETQRLKLQNEKLQFELEVLRREYSRNADIEAWVGEMVIRAKTILLKLPGKCAPLVIGRTEVDAERILRDDILEALSQLAAKPPKT